MKGTRSCRAILFVIFCLLFTIPAFADVLTIPDGVKEIGEEAFYGDTSLDEVVLPDQIKRIESKAFSKSSVKTVFLPDSLEFIADDAFDTDADINMTANPGTRAYSWAVDHGFIKETDIVIPANAGDFEYSDNPDGTCTVTKYIGANKENIVIPKWSSKRKLVTVIGSYAFQNRNDLSGSLTIPDSITRIDYFAFDGCSGFTGDLVLPNSITVINGYAFRGCSGFTGRLILPDGLTNIASGIFNQCSGFDGDLIIPDGVTAVGAFAFQGCSKLTGSLIIPDGVTVIENGAFDECSGFNGILKIPDSVTRIESWAFFGCSGLTGELKIPNGVTIIKESTFDGCSGFNGNLTIPDGVIIIEAGAFSDCSGFNGNLIIPDSVTTIEAASFSGCSSLTGNLIIPDSVTTIEFAAFSECRGFTGSLVIPDSVTTMGAAAFSGCSGFNGSLTISNSLTSIGEHAFYRCSGLTGDLIIPDGVLSIGEWAFTYCSGFNGSLTIPDGVTSIGNNAFYDCSGFTGTLKLPESITSIGGYAFHSCSGFTGSLVLPNHITNINEYTFLDCSGFTGSLIIPESVVSIGASAFNGCSGLSGSLTIPNNVTSIGEFAFLRCEGFSGRLTIPSSVTSIGNAAFGYSDYLNFKKIAVQVTNDDGTTSEVLRTAVYCPRGSNAWSWAETEYKFEPVEWDGDYTSLPEESQLYGAFSDDSMVLTLGEPNKIPAGYVKSIGQDIYRVSITVAGYEMDDPVNNRYGTDVFVDHHTKEVSLTDWAAFYLDTTRTPFNVPGTYTIKLWANVIEGKGEELDSMTVTVIDPEIEQYITFASGSDFIGEGEEVTSTIPNGKIVSRVQYPLTPGMKLTIPFRADLGAQVATVSLLQWNESEQDYRLCLINGAEITASTSEFQTSGTEKTGILYLMLPDGNLLPSGMYVLKLSCSNGATSTVDAQVEISVIQAETPPAGSLSLSESTWILGTVFAEEKMITVTSEGDWKVKSDSVPSWLKVLNPQGVSGDMLCLSCETNNGMARLASVIIASGDSTVSLKIIQPGASDEAVINFASINGLTLIGTPANIRISVSNADSVEVMTDGATEGSRISVRNGTQTVTHIFEKGGDQQVVLIPYRNGVMGTPYDMGTIHIRDFGSLAVPTLNCEDVILGETQSLSWAAVPGAENYALILQHEGKTVDSWLLPADQCQYDLTPGVLTDTGAYTVLLKARAYGYNESSTTAAFSVIMPVVNFSIIAPKTGDAFIKGDLMDIQVSNPDGHHIAVKVTPEDPAEPIRWLPADGSTCSDTLIKETFYFQPAKAQRYTFEAFAWAGSVRDTEERAWHDPDRAVQISISGPVFINKAIDGSAAKVRLQSEVTELTVKTNNAVTQTSVYLDGSDVPFETKSGEEGYQQLEDYVRTWTFDLSKPAAGKYHTYLIKATDGEKEIETEIEFYCVEDCETAIVYSKTNSLPIRRYPGESSQNSIFSISMMDDCQLLGTYGEYSYIRRSGSCGFTLSTNLSSEIVYDPDRFELAFDELEEDGEETVYTYIGAPAIHLSWQSNKDSFNNPDLVYMLTIQPLERRSGTSTIIEDKVYKFIANVAGKFKFQISLYDKVKDLIIKTTTMLKTYVVYPNLQDYINHLPETQLNYIDTRAESFERALDYFIATDVASTSDSAFVKLYRVAELKAESFAALVESDHTKAEDIASTILCTLADAVPDTEPISSETVSLALDCMKVPTDLASAVKGYWNPIIRYVRDPKFMRKIGDGINNSSKGLVRRYALKASDFGDKVTYAAIAYNIGETIINSLIVINKFAKVPDEQIETIIQEYQNSNSPLLNEVARKLGQYKTSDGRILYAAGKIGWSVLEGVLEVGKNFALEALKEVAGCSVLSGLSIGTTIGNMVFNSSDLAETSAKAKWAVEALKDYIPTFRTARANFMTEQTAENYQAFAYSVSACQQLLINAYTKMSDFMYAMLGSVSGMEGTWKIAKMLTKYTMISSGNICFIFLEDSNEAISSYWAAVKEFYDNNYQETIDQTNLFIGRSNQLMSVLDMYWSDWLQGECSQVVMQPAGLIKK